MKQSKKLFLLPSKRQRPHVVEEIPESDQRRVYEVMYTRVRKKARWIEGYLSFTPKRKCSLHTLSGRTLMEDFFISSEDSPEKRIREVSIDDIVILGTWKVEIEQEITLPEFITVVDNVMNDKKKLKKSIENLKPIYDGENIGKKLLLSMGWNIGSGLGKQDTGLKEPLGITLRECPRKGIGYH